MRGRYGGEKEGPKLKEEMRTKEVGGWGEEQRGRTGGVNRGGDEEF